MKYYLITPSNNDADTAGDVAASGENSIMTDAGTDGLFADPNPAFHGENDAGNLPNDSSPEERRPMVPAAFPGAVFAGLGIRLTAFLIDFILLSGILALILLTTVPDGEGGLFRPGIIISVLVGWMLYFAVFESSARMGTPGKMLLRLKVVDRHGEKLSFNVALVRFLLKMVSVLVMGFGIWNIASDAACRGWHDLNLNTLVIRTAPRKYRHPGHFDRRRELPG